MKFLKQLSEILVLLILVNCASQVYQVEEVFPKAKTAVVHTDRELRLDDVSHWFYYLGFEPDDDIIEQIANSTYDMVVMEPIFLDRENTDFPIAEVISQFKNALHSKLVIAYIDIGQAEDWRTYWQTDWRIGNPDWIVAGDPDGWEGNFPVAFWNNEWRQIWLGENGYLQSILDAGFDGIYLDWVEAYSDENVIAAAERDNVQPREEMIRWVADLADFCRTRKPDFFVIGQNAAELTEHDGYLAVIDAIAQEQTWFDGAADNNPPGDCPLPRTNEDVETSEYVRSLSRKCRQMYYDFPDSTLHVSSEEYLYYLNLARDKGITVFTIDYAVKQENIEWVYRTSRELGFVPFVSERALSLYLDPVK
jgi:cysteinyl-tRNA synthetase